ncbi:hypothetical protein H5410_031164, partial [Solanum commersonii]
IEAELQIISNVGLVREIQFLRFCQKMLKVLELLWMSLSTQSKKVRNKIKLKNVEGSLLVALFKMCLMVIWIEQMEYDEFFFHHLYLPLIRAGLGFGAERWMSYLQRQSEFLIVMASFVDSTVYHEYFIITPCPYKFEYQLKKFSFNKILFWTVDSKDEIGMKILAQHMTRNFCAGICATPHSGKKFN